MSTVSSSASSHDSASNSPSEISNFKSEISPRKLAANRTNARKSTGPKSPQGKSRSARNATTLGLYSSHNVLGCEDPGLFLELRSAYLADLHPQTPIELLLAEQIVSAAWKIRRIHAAEYHLHALTSATYHAAAIDAQETYHQAKDLHDRRAAAFGPKSVPPLPPPPVDFTNIPLSPGTTLAHILSREDDHALDRLNLLEQRLQRSIHRALNQLRTLRKSRPDSHDLPQHPYLDHETRTQLLSAQEQNHPQQNHPQPKNEQIEPTVPSTPPPSTNHEPSTPTTIQQNEPTVPPLPFHPEGVTDCNNGCQPVVEPSTTMADPIPPLSAFTVHRSAFFPTPPHSSFGLRHSSFPPTLPPSEGNVQSSPLTKRSP